MISFKRPNCQQFFLSLFVVFLCCLWVWPQAYADQVVLKSGKVFSGDIVKFENNRLQITEGENSYSIKVPMIAEVSVDSEDPQKIEWVTQINTILDGAREAKSAKEKAQLETITSKKVDLYIKKGYPPADDMEAYLREKGVAFNKFNIRSDALAMHRYKEYGGTEIPLVVIDDQYVVNGYYPARVWRLLNQ